MSGFTTRNRLFLCKIEPTPGTDSVPVVGTDAIKTEAPLPTPNFELVERAEASGTLDASNSAIGGGSFGFTGKVYLKGPGIGNGGTAPESDPILRSAGMAVTILAADVTGTAQAGTPATIQLAAADVTTDDDFIGQTITLDGGTGSGQTRMITDSVASTDTLTITPDWDTDPDATTTYTISASAIYQPASSALENVTAYLYDKSSKTGDTPLLRRAVGAASNLVFNIPTRGAPNVDFTMTGLLPGIPTQVADPGAAAFDTHDGRVFRNVSLFINDYSPKESEWSVDLGNTVAQADDATQEFGFDIACITERRTTGSVNPNLDLLVNNDAFGDFINEVTQPMWGQWGTVGGNRVSIYMPAIKYRGYTPGDNDGFNTEDLEFESTSPDASIYVCFD